MPKVNHRPTQLHRRTQARIDGEDLARQAIAKLGKQIRLSRRRRQLTQQALADHVGISRQRLGNIEAGEGMAVPSDDWFSLAKALGIYLKFEFGRDAQAELRDAWHADIQELVLRVSKPAGWERAWEGKSGSWASDRSVDVRLLDRRGRRLVVGECWNTFGDLGQAARSSDHKGRDAQQQAVAVAGEGEPFAVGLVWIVRDTRANRELIERYGEIFGSRFPGSSQRWVQAIMEGGPMPAQPGLIWCDVRATRLFARRMPRGKSSPPER